MNHAMKHKVDAGEAVGRVFAAFDARFYQRAGFVCLWLR